MWRLTVERKYMTNDFEMTDCLYFKSKSLPELIDLISKLEEVADGTYKYIVEKVEG